MIYEVEGDIRKRLLKIERPILQGCVDLQGIADCGPTLEYKDQVLKRLAVLYDRWYVSGFGEITISQTIYGTLPRSASLVQRVN